MIDTLERERQLGNLIDEVFALKERVRQLEERLAAATATTDVVVPHVEGGRTYRLIVKTIVNDVNPEGVEQLFLRPRRG